MKADCKEDDIGTLKGRQEVLVKPLPDRIHFRRFRIPSMILTGNDEQSRLDSGRLELSHNPLCLLINRHQFVGVAMDDQRGGIPLRDAGKRGATINNGKADFIDLGN